MLLSCHAAVTWRAMVVVAALLFPGWGALQIAHANMRALSEHAGMWEGGVHDEHWAMFVL